MNDEKFNKVLLDLITKNDIREITDFLKLNPTNKVDNFSIYWCEFKNKTEILNLITEFNKGK